MMTRLICLTLLIAITQGHAQESVTIPEAQTLSDFQLPVNTQSVYTIQYNIQLQDRVMPDSSVFTDTLLSKGMESNYSFNEHGFLLYIQVDSFDERGKVIKNAKVKYVYGEKGKLASVVHFEDGKMADSIFIGYNRKNEVDEQIYYDRKGRKEGRAQYFYRNGKVFNVKQRGEDDLLLNFIRYEYDAAGNLKEKEVKGNTLQYESSLRYTYDTLDNGYIQINEFAYGGANKIKGMCGRVYDKMGRVVETTIADSNKRVVASSTFEYNEIGLPVSELTFRMYKYDYTYRYEYEEKGWWKTRRKFERGKPISRTHRVVELFKETAAGTD